MPNSMVTEISRASGSGTFQVKGKVRKVDPAGQVFVQVFVTQAGGAVASGGAFLDAADGGDFTVTAQATAGSTFQDAVLVTAVSHATEIWASSLTPPPAGFPVPPGTCEWKVKWGKRPPA